MKDYKPQYWVLLEEIDRSRERIKALEEALRAWVEKECDYMRKNNLGNPEVQPAVIWSRTLLKEADQ